MRCMFSANQMAEIIFGNDNKIYQITEKYRHSDLLKKVDLYLNNEFKSV